MKYVITDTQGKYLKCEPSFTWVNDIKKAVKFSSEQAARNAATTTFAKQVRDFAVVEYETSAGLRVLTKEEAENMAATINSAFLILESITKSDIDSLRYYYVCEEKKYNGIQQDLLHKLELDSSITGIKAVKFMRDMKKMRKERRQVKDFLAFAEFLQESGLSNLIGKICSYKKSKENRKYTPREMPELFEE